MASSFIPLGGIGINGVADSRGQARTVIHPDAVAGKPLTALRHDRPLAKLGLFILQVIETFTGSHSPLAAVLELDKGLRNKGRYLRLGVIKQGIRGQIVLRVRKGDLPVEMDVLGALVINAAVALEDGLLVDDLPSQPVRAFMKGKIVDQDLCGQHAFVIGEFNLVEEIDHFIAGLIVQVVGINVYRIVIIDMDMSEAIHIIGLRVHDQAVAIYQRCALANADIAYQGLNRACGIGGVVAVRVIPEDVDDLDRVTVGRPERHLPNLRPGA